MSTPYDKKSVDLLYKLKVKIFKIASTDSNNYQLIEYIAKKRKKTGELNSKIQLLL